MKRVLFLLGAYYPAPKANGICCGRVIDELCSQGFEVDVIAFAPEWPCRDTSIHGVKVFYIKGSMYYRTLRDAETQSIVGVRYKLRKSLNRLKNIFLAPLWPDNSRICTAQFLHKAEELHAQTPYDVVVGVVSPVSAVSAAAKFKAKHPDVKYIAYFLDAVSGGVTPKELPTKLGIKMGLRWEKRVLADVDRVVVMQSHREHHEKYSRAEPYFKRMTVLDIPLLYAASQNETGENDGKIHIVYVGAINMAVKNPLYFLQLFEKLPDNIVLDIFGSIDDMRVFAQYRNNQNIRLHGEIPHELALEKQKNADFLLNIGSTNPCMIPSKIFEYMSSCKPIISTYRIDEEPSLPYLKKYKACLAIDERETSLEANVNKLVRFITDYKDVKVDQEEIMKAFKNNTPKAFADAVKSLLQ